MPEKEATQRAITYAAKVVESAHGNYSPENSGRVFNFAGAKSALVTQFRKFQVILFEHVIRMGTDAKLLGVDTRGMSTQEAAEATQAAKEARISLGYSIGLNSALFGLRAVPGISTIAGIYGLVSMMMSAGDDDADIDDMWYDFRTFLEDSGFSTESQDLLLNGLQTKANMDATSMFGWGEMTSIVPYTDISLSKEGISSLLYALTGATGGTLNNLVLKPYAIMENQQDPVAASIQALPRGPREALQAQQMGTKGIKTIKGSTLFSPSELDGGEQGLKAFGFMSNKESRSRELGGYIRAQDELVASLENKAIKRLINAVQYGGDINAPLAMFAKIQTTKEKFGIKTSEDGDAIARAVRRIINDEMRINGVRYRKGTVNQVQQMMQGR